MKEFDQFKDKRSWGPGPWQNEPDRLEWRYKGFPLLMARNIEVTGSWCGYVGIPPKHPFYKKNYNDINGVTPHGGLTYSDKCQGHICNVPQAGESDQVWWLGFDCSHFMDVSPKMNATMNHLRKLVEGRFSSYEGPGMGGMGKYRDVKYVKKECEDLADQLIACQRKKKKR